MSTTATPAPVLPAGTASLLNNDPQYVKREERTDALKSQYPNLFVVPPTPFLLHVHAIMRNKDSPRSEFIFHSDLLFRTLIEYSLELVDFTPQTVSTTTGNQYNGLTIAKPITGVSILRSGAVLEKPLMESVPNVQIGKILVQRDESTEDKGAKLFYSKLPDNITETTVMLLDPMLATGGSAMVCIDVLLQHGVQEENIVFVNAISAPEGIHALFAKFPKVKLITTMVDEYLNSARYIIPGIGDYGDRHYATEEH